MFNNKDRKILTIGSHPDDIEIGCGGFLTKYKSDNKLFGLICSGGEMGGIKDQRLKEARAAGKILGATTSIFNEFKDGFIRHDSKLVDQLEKYIMEVNPDIVFTHSPDDRHQDHIAVSKATQAAMRNSNATLMFYPSWNIRTPFNYNVVVDIDVKEKQKLLNVFMSLKDKPYMRVTDNTEKFYLTYLSI